MTRKGGMQPIALAVKTRQGRKVVTVITGLETYGIKVDEFAEDLKRICAGSASSKSLSTRILFLPVLVQWSCWAERSRETFSLAHS